MATYFLVQTLRVGTRTYYAGVTIDDAVIDTGPLTAAGAILWPTSDTIVAAGAARAIAARKSQGADELTLDFIMQEAVTASLGGGAGGDAPGDGTVTLTKMAAVFGLGNLKLFATGATGDVVAGPDARIYQKVTLTLARALLVGLGAGIKTYTLAAGAALPAGARLVGNEIASITGFDDATHAVFNLSVDGTALGDIGANVNVSAGQVGFPKAGGPGALGYPAAPLGAVTPSITLTSTVDLNTATVGTVTVNLFYSVMP